jgi:hypothetical protein
MRSFSGWRVHFEQNRLRPLPPVEAPVLPPSRHLALVRSLKRFQLGESGEGRIAHEVDRLQAPGVDPDYRVALKLFVAEEGRHAGILARMVLVLGDELLARDWSERLFVRARRALGVRFKLLVLLAAEVIGIGFYGLLGQVLPEGAMASALAQLCEDEEAHLRFHCEFLSLQPRMLRWCWWPIGVAATFAVLASHRHTLRAFDIPLSIAARRLLERVREAAQRLQRAPAATQLVMAQS